MLPGRRAGIAGVERTVKGEVIMRIWLFSAIAVWVLSGCAGPEDLPALEQEGPPAQGYRLDTGDQLRVTVFNQAQLTGDYRVGADGTISMPLIGEVSARDQTTGELEQTLTRRLSVEKNLLVEPSVNVQVETYRPFFILGEVRNPGEYPCPYDTTVLSAVAIAGGSHRLCVDHPQDRFSTRGAARGPRQHRPTRRCDLRIRTLFLTRPPAERECREEAGFRILGEACAGRCGPRWPYCSSRYR
jgi:hypothetical protein